MKTRIRNILLESVDFKERPNINDAFWKWFGDSKVVDANGNPLVVYHGTTKDFSRFSMKSSRAIFFSTSSHHAEGFPEGTRHKEGVEKRIIPVYLKIEKLWDYKNKDSIDFIKMIAKKYYRDQEFDFDWIATRGYNWIDVEDHFVHHFQEHGYDGFTVTEAGKRNYAVFNPTQIKSIFNQGTWDPNDLDIMK